MILTLQGQHLSFSNEGLALMRTFAMMMELNFVDTFVQPPQPCKNKGELSKGEEIPYKGASYFMLLIFMVLMPILLMNLLIGLAVGDIESVRRNAQLKRLAMQVNESSYISISRSLITGTWVEISPSI